jgi:phage/plasmid-associated DNA primase
MEVMTMGSPKKEFARMLKEIADDLDDGEDRDDSISAHYGVTDKYLKECVQEAYINFIKSEKISTALDKTFPKTSAEDRIKIFAFGTAMKMMETMKERVLSKRLGILAG